jgi:prolyl 4-hydroxylase
MPGAATRHWRPLDALAGTGDANALFTLGLWRLGGRCGARDIRAARGLFKRAGQAGRIEGALIHTNFVAAGVGGPADWARGIAQLRLLARRDRRAAEPLALIERMRLTRSGDPVAVPPAEPLSEQPHVRRFDRLLTHEECDYLVRFAGLFLRPSVIVDPSSGRQVANPIRTSDGAELSPLLENPAVHAINRRIAAASGTPVDNGEPLQVLRYSVGQEYREHFDYLHGLDNQRTHTVLIYLNDGYAGGETIFGQTGLTIRGAKGDAILFRNVLDDGAVDPLSRHRGATITSGQKYIASRWIRARRFLV